MIRSRALAAKTDAIFQKIIMASKTGDDDGSIQFDYTFEISLDELGRPKAIKVDAQPEEQEAVNSAIRAALQATNTDGNRITPSRPEKPFGSAISEYFTKSQLKPQSKATYRSKLVHAQHFFGETRDVLSIGQADFVSYCEHVTATIQNITSQGHYMATVATFLNWHRQRTTGLPALSTKTLMPKRDTPEADERDAFTLDQLRLVFENAKQYRWANPYKFWTSIVPAFTGCRIEELCQIHLKTDFLKDSDAGVWYLVLDGRPDPDGVLRKSLKKPSSWRSVPLHPALVRHGFVEFLERQRSAGFLRPFEKEWNPREEDDPELGRIIKWSHYTSKWGGRELNALVKRHQFDKGKLVYFHSMRHSFKAILGDAGVPSEISEALCGRRYGGADAERYEKLKRNHVRLYKEGVEPGLDALDRLLDEILRG